ncbi:hypothetical protein ACC870_38425, partial [Rhizobium ruizarguesonis]
VLQILEKKFGDWLIAKHGSIAEASKRWEGLTTPRDSYSEGRVGFRPLWNIANERRQRDLDTAQFLYETQRDFYQSMYD